MFIWKNIINHIDRALCAYFGLEKEERVKPNKVEFMGDRLAISATTSYRRYSHTEDWHKFSKELGHVSTYDKKRLGIAIGKVLAKKLVISFDQASIRGSK